MRITIILSLLVSACKAPEATQNKNEVPPAVSSCASNHGGCDAHATCVDSDAGAVCNCSPGYMGNGRTCSDIDECATNNGGCSANAACTNAPGSFGCACTLPYVGDGVTCALPGPVTLAVAPTNASVLVNTSLKFVAALTNATNNDLQWSVNGIVGGTAPLGSIMPDGTYLAPAVRPHPTQVTIEAKSVQDPTKVAVARVDVTADGVLYLSQTNSNVAAHVFPGLLSLAPTGHDIAPTSVLGGANAGLSSPIGLLVDFDGDRVFAGDVSNKLVTFAGVSTRGDAVPSGIVAGTGTHLSIVESIQLDAASQRLWVAGQSNEILVFDASSTLNGNVAPLHIIKDSAELSTSDDKRIFLDTTNDRLYLVDATNNGVFVFDHASLLVSGDIVASRKLSGPSTELSGPWGVTVDQQRDILYVCGYNNNLVNAYTGASSVSGDTAPARSFSIATAGSLYNLSIDAETDRLLVGADDSVWIFDSASTRDGALGPVDARLYLMGPTSGIASSQGLFMDWDR